MSSENVKDLINKSNQLIKDFKKKQLLKKLKLKNLKSARNKFIKENVPSIPPVNLEKIDQEADDRLLQKNEIMDSIRSSIEELKKQKFDRINLKSNDKSFNNSLNDTSEKVSPMNEESEKSITINQPEEKNISDNLQDAVKTSDAVEDGDIAESIGKSVANIGKVAGDVGDTLESAAASITAGGGEIDPIQDIIGGILAIGGAIASGVSVDEKRTPQIPEPIIEQQQSMQGVEA